jgi:hypothetical protein
MGTTRRRVSAAATVAVALLAWAALGGVASGAPPEAARVEIRPQGSVKVDPGEPATNAGAVVRLRDDTARATLTHTDGGTVQVVGPAVVRVLSVSDTGWRIQLVSGVISEARVRGVALEIQTPHDASLVLQNATGFARVAPGERVTFQRKDGEYARVHAGGAVHDLRNEAWTQGLRTPSATGPVAATAPRTAAAPVSHVGVAIGNDRDRYVLGARVVVVEPASTVKKTDLNDGAVRFCNQGRDWAVVYIGTDTVLYLAPGDCVTFDRNGNVTSFDGISHIYHPLSEELPFDEPVENAADASISRSKAR